MTVRYRCLLLAVLLLAVLVVSQAAQAQDEPIGVAVMKFRDNQLTRWWGSGWNVGEGITQLVTDELANRGRFRLIERTRLNEIMSEKGLAQSGDLDPSTTIELGRLMGVRIMILGNVTSFELKGAGGIGFGGFSLGAEKGQVVLTGRIVDVQTGEILSSVRAEGSGTGTRVAVNSYRGLSFESEAFTNSTLGKAANQAIKSFVDQVTAAVDNASLRITQAQYRQEVEGMVVGMVGTNVVVNLGTGRGVRKGAKLQVYRLQEMEGLSSLVRVPVAVLRVIDAQPEASVCLVESSSDAIQRGDVAVLQ